MRWTNFFDDIYVLNLSKRTDRLLDITEQFEKYSIPFKRIQAIEHERGAEGLSETMVKLFEDCIDKNMQNILVFEDDALIVVGQDEFELTMNNVVEQIPNNYWMCFLGCQVTAGFSHFHSPNILRGNKMFSTHAVMYSKQGMKECLSNGFYAPIDNYYVEKLEPYGNSYCTYPLLCSQKEGFSDIGQNTISWRPFIEQKYYQQLNQMKAR